MKVTNIQHFTMARAVQGVENSTTRICRSQQEDDKRYRTVHNIKQDFEDKEMVTQEFDAVRPKILKCPQHQISNNHKFKNKKHPKNQKHVNTKCTQALKSM